mmetsp:Transcript_42990/g.73343  ORF Transcript_42990/g.73343 Transcript_42990/m.73343 type:complete len:85 (+) Transcript_42990:610-864(+)
MLRVASGEEASAERACEGQSGSGPWQVRHRWIVRERRERQRTNGSDRAQEQAELGSMGEDKRLVESGSIGSGPTVSGVERGGSG